ncbi:thiamine-phosphate kinase [Paenalcaligenes sp. Me52]|uniref:thiamine-phosphate kinase n=1 Tax=Paenalcaligenes sp. Me52 TaxID=3392038 RepID=UPI003D2AE8AB
MPKEFDLIAQYFTRPAPEKMVGVGDDCAIFSLRSGHDLATSTDLLLEGRHFFSDVDPYLLGRKALAVNLSDLAAAGASARACLLSLALPSVDEAWLAGFSRGFLEMADAHHCPLIGGDTTRSLDHITIGVTVMGEVPRGKALLRSDAQEGDDIWVTGCLGAADLALRYLSGSLELDPQRLQASRAALENPAPPVSFATHLPGMAHAAIDISDGLAQDLGHILKASQCGAELMLANLPMHDALRGLSTDLQNEAMLAGGDVFQLCFTAAATQRDALQALAEQHDIVVHRIGRIVNGSGLRVLDQNGQPLLLAHQGFDHFA